MDSMYNKPSERYASPTGRVQPSTYGLPSEPSPLEGCECDDSRVHGETHVSMSYKKSVSTNIREKMWVGAILPCREKVVLYPVLGEFFGSMILMFWTVLPVMQQCRFMAAVDPAWQPAAAMFGNLFLGVVQFVLQLSISASFLVISGALLNPHLTLISWPKGHICALATLVFLVVQFAGSLCGVLLVHIFFPSDGCMFGLPVVASGFSVWRAFVAETFGATVILLVALFAREKYVNSPLAMGAVTALPTFCFFSLTGASFNAYRYLASAIVSLHIAHAWLYILAPILGSFLAYVIHYVIKVLMHEPACLFSIKPRGCAVEKSCSSV